MSCAQGTYCIKEQGTETEADDNHHKHSNQKDLLGSVDIYEVAVAQVHELLDKGR